MKLRSSSVVVAMGILMLLSATPAYADPPPPEQRVFVTGRGEGAQGGNTVNFFSVDLSAAPADTTLTGTMTSCGRVITQARGGFLEGRGFAQFDLLSDFELGKLVGPTYEYSLTITSPGFDPYVVAGANPVTLVKRPTCEEINNPLVPSFSRKKARRTVVGRTISVTSTTAPGAQVTYEWKVANSAGRLVGKTVGSSTSLRIRRTWVGRKVGVVIKVNKPGYLSQSERVTFSTVRRR